MESKYITSTEGRLTSIINNFNSNAIEKVVPEKISNAVNDAKIRTGVITKFYQYLDKAEVKLDHNGKTVLCKILHRYGGEIMEYYTPLMDSSEYDEKLHEPYVVPRSSNHVLVISIHDDDSNENLILGYYQNEEIVGYNPAKPGNIKLMCHDGDNQYWVKFGIDGLDYRGSSSPKIVYGDTDDDMEELDPTDNYTKEEVDAILDTYDERIKYLEDIIEELLPPSEEDDEPALSDDTYQG